MNPKLAPLLAELAIRHNFDANENAFVERQLTAVKQKTYEVLYPDLLAMSFLPIATDIPETADNYVYIVYDTVGEAKIISNGATDLPRVDMNGREVPGKVYTIGDAYGWNVFEMKEANRIGVPLSAMKAKAARDAIERQIDKMLASGTTDSQTGLNTNVTGLINNADVVANGITSFTAWTKATSPDTVANELNDFAASIVTATKQKIIPDTVLLPTPRFKVAAELRMGTSSDVTVLQWVLKTSPYIKNVAQWYRLDGAGASGKDRAIAYKRDPAVLEAVVPQQFTQWAAQLQGLEMVNPCTGRCGGVKVYQPAAMLYGDFG